VLDPDDTGTPAPRSLLRRVEHALIDQLTRGAVARVARRRGAPTLNNSPPVAAETGPTSPAS